MTYTFKDPLKDKLLSILICTLIVLNWACDEAGEVSAGEVSAGEVSAGEVSAGEVSAGEVSAGEVNPLSMLTDQVKVQFDEVGGLHLTCKTATDCFTAQGYYHAAHRFTQMDINRLFPQGRLGERIGNLALDIDRRNRLLFSTKDGQSIEEQMWAACSAESRAMLEAYTIGVNAWLAKWRAGDPEAKLSEEYDFSIFDKSTIRDWTPLDSLSVAMVLIQDLTERSGTHLRNARLLSNFGADIYFDVYGEAPAFPTAILNGSEGVDASASPISTSKNKELNQSILREGYHQIYQRLRTYNAMFNADEWESYSAWRRLPERTNHPIGSNNWVVAPSRSSTDHAWLSNDPHLGLSNPSIWYLAHLKVENEREDGSTEFNVTGVTLPGIPSIIIGHNEHIAWGMTTTYFDFTDLYIEELSEDGEHVIFNGEEVPIYHREDRFDFAGLPTEQHESLYVPHHGPIISIDREAGTAISMRWTGQDADTDFNFLLGLARSSTVGEAKEAIKNVTTIGQNFVIADDQGEIAWFPYNRLPSRPWVSASLNPAFPLPGDGQAEWGMPIPYESLPQLINPELGIIVTANHDMTGALSDGDATNDAQESGVAQAMQERPAFGYRYSQSMRLVDREMPHDRQSLTDAIHDRELLVGRRLLPALITAVDVSMLSESGQRVLGVLSRWGEGLKGYDCPAGLSLDSVDQSRPSSDPQEIEDSAACYAFHVLYSELGKHIFRDELIEMGGDQNINPDYEATARLIARPELLMGGVSYWDDVSTEITEDPSLIIAEAMNSTGSYFSREYGVNTEDWLWGKVHTVTMNASILNEAGVREFNNGPYPNHGGLYTVDVANPRNLFTRQYDHSAGASMRFVCELSSPPICQIEMPGGQRHHRDSPYYDDLLHKWLDRDPILLPFEAADVETRSVESFDWPLSDQ